ncbi:hypothetical protein BU14_2644s0001, partial [Porphyra umbilicalis]
PAAARAAPFTPTDPTVAVLWLRADLRLADNALLRAGADASALLPVYVFDPAAWGAPSAAHTLYGTVKGGAHRAAFVTAAVAEVRAGLAAVGSGLAVRVGDPAAVLADVVARLLAAGTPVRVVASKEFCAEEVAAERSVAAALAGLTTPDGVPPVALQFVWEGTLTHLDDLGFNPLTDTPPVFTQYRKRMEGGPGGRDGLAVRPPAPAPTRLPPLPGCVDATLLGAVPSLGDLGLDAAAAAVDGRAALDVRGGEAAASARLQTWMVDGDHLRHYKETRNDSGTDAGSSKLAAWLATGCVSPRTVYAAIRRYEAATGVRDDNTYWLVFELLTRDFFRWTAAAVGPTLFAWRGHGSDRSRGDFAARRFAPTDTARFDAWAAGATGVPFVDAGMRELAATGYLSNRLRQNVASFLINELGCPDWRAGAAHFEATLVDYEPAANWGNWAYIAGVGADPRGGRAFNTVKQGGVYDPAGAYTKLWVPELAALPPAQLWEVGKVDPATLAGYGVTLG